MTERSRVGLPRWTRAARFPLSLAPLLALLFALPSSAVEPSREPMFRIVGERDGHPLVQRNGKASFAIGDLGPAVNAKVWENLGPADRHTLIDHYNWDLGRRRAEMGKATSDAMAAFANDEQGWTTLVDAKVAAHAAKEWPEFETYFATRPQLTLPTGLDPNVAESTAFRELRALYERINKDWDAGHEIYGKMRTARWDQVGIAVKGISGPLIKIIMDNFGGGFRYLSSTRASVAALQKKFVELQKKLAEWQAKKALSHGEVQGEAAALLEKIQLQLDEMETTVGEIHTGLSTDTGQYQAAYSRLLEDNAAAVKARAARAQTAHDSVDAQEATAVAVAAVSIDVSGEPDQAAKIAALEAAAAALRVRYQAELSGLSADGEAVGALAVPLDWGMFIYQRVVKLNHALAEGDSISIPDPNHEDPATRLLFFGGSQWTDNTIPITYVWQLTANLADLANPDHPCYGIAGMPDTQFAAMTTHLADARQQVADDADLLANVASSAGASVDARLAAFAAILAEAKGIDDHGLLSYTVAALVPIPDMSGFQVWIDRAADHEGYAAEMNASLEAAATGLSLGQDLRATRVREAMQTHDTARMNFLLALSATWDKQQALDAHRAIEPYGPPDSWSDVPGIKLAERLATLNALPASPAAARDATVNATLTLLRTAKTTEDRLLHDLQCLQNATYDANGEFQQTAQALATGIGGDVQSRYWADYKAISGIEFIQGSEYDGYGSGAGKWVAGWGYQTAAGDQRSTIENGLSSIAGYSEWYFRLVDLADEAERLTPSLARLSDLDFTMAWNDYSSTGHEQVQLAQDNGNRWGFWPASDAYYRLITVLYAAQYAWDAAHLVRPTVTISPNQQQVATDPVLFAISTSAPVVGLSATDLSVTGGTLLELTGAGDSYQATVHPLASGSVRLSLADGAASTSQGASTPAASASVTYVQAESSLIGVVITPNGTRVPGRSFAFQLEFGEAITGLSAASLTLTNASLDALTGSGRLWRAQVTVTGTGEVGLTLTPGAGVGESGARSTPASAVLVLPAAPVLLNLSHTYTSKSDGTPVPTTPALLGLRTNEVLRFDALAGEWQLVAVDAVLSPGETYLVASGLTPVAPLGVDATPILPAPPGLRQGWNLRPVRAAASWDELEVVTSAGQTVTMGSDGGAGACNFSAWMVDPVTGAYSLVVPAALADNIPGAVSAIPAGATLWLFQAAPDPAAPSSN